MYLVMTKNLVALSNLEGKSHAAQASLPLAHCANQEDRLMASTVNV